ncbi:PAS domain S-box protein [Mesorhizobium sp. B2-4-12]|uniref:AAA family ATPase n=2 Tax=Mesorhizobium sp. B2-4-12 TaxID=2589937 RepID=UPI00112C45E6|nr:AAA family ATPase [Mesorhizobium sp. B2-4-12]TPK96956.1 PAS domain S-box protein [Mesorhizobium sp. B2-4-12]
MVSDPPSGAYEGIGSQAAWEDGERAFRRGWRPDESGKQRPVLFVQPATDHQSRSGLDRLIHEFELKDKLDRAWAVRPLELVHDAGRTILVLEDVGGEPLARLLGAPMEVGRFLQLATGIAAALGKLHQRGLIHKDIKPANVLVNAATGEVWLTGFGIASRLARERQPLDAPETIAGTFAYMAPEQTGRMNRSIDSRSDLYALGISFYQMLAGGLPFTAAEPMEWVHCHLARQPVELTGQRSDIPGTVSAVVMKLLAKRAEDRYQTASGLESDLRRCQAEWGAQHRIDDFSLGARDTPDQLRIPEKLYGRREEVETLLASFDRVVKGGAPELVLVSGYSGIGKSSLVNELQPALIPPRGLFASGKFDQHKRDIPYSTLVQAFQGLIRPLLGKSETDLVPWREALRETLGPNARLIVDLIPEVKLIIGEPPPVPEVPPQDAQRRFQLVLRRFLTVFARQEHPLALFLDDLQWLDEATLSLLQELLSQSDLRHLLLIGAFRNNEVTAAHPLMRKLEAIRATGRVQDIKLGPLAPNDLRSLVADSFHCDAAEQAGPLAELVLAKTEGNPFFVIQFLHLLADERLLAFDHGQARWSFDLGGIHAKQYTDNVVGLLAGKLTRLPLDTQEALRQLACLGNIADATMLSMVLGRPEEEVHAALREALRQQLIERLDHSYKFVHDRVQEAAYALIPEKSRAEAHLTIGRLLVAHTPPEKRDEAIFEIVNQLNRGTPLITSLTEREQLAELNLAAGKRAKASSAYGSALTYLTAGAALLPVDAWERRQELAFELELHPADCEVCTGALQAAEERLNSLAARVVGTVQRCAVGRRLVDLYAMLGAGEQAVAVALECLQGVGIDWSPHPSEEETRREYERIWSLLGNRAIEDVVNLPLMQDPEAFATLDMLTKLSLPAEYIDENLVALSICRATNLSLERGNSDAAPVSYAATGLIASAHFGDQEKGYRLGKMACDLVERRGLNHFGGRVYNRFAVVVPWTRPLAEAIDPARRAFQMAKRHGEPAFAAFSCRSLISILLALGHPLDQVEDEAEQGLEFVLPFGFFLDRMSAPLALVRTLRGKTTKFGSLDDGWFKERAFEERATGQPAGAFLECHYWIRKLQARFFASDYLSAVGAAEKVDTWYATSAPLSLLMLEKTEYHFYAALSHASLCQSADSDPSDRHRVALATHERELRGWAANSPQNFEGRAALVGAEIARIEGRPLEAMDLYECAIASARANGFINDEAIANELTARFYAARGYATIAATYLREARSCYLRWGADGKVRQLEALYPSLREFEPARTAVATIAASVEQLDFATVVKVSQAVSSEMELEKLIDALMHLAIEHAGAERGLLLLSHGDDLRHVAVATTGQDGIIVRQGDELAAAFPGSIVRYVMRSRENVIVDDASAHPAYSSDPYVQEQHARSILCMPLVNEAKVGGVLYLENDLTSHAFTPDRVTVLKVLASQAAISIENSRLYRALAEREAIIRRREEATRVALETVAEGGPLKGTLELLCHTMEQESVDSVIACIHPVNEDATMFRDTAAPSLDENYRKAIDGLPVSSMIGPCCYAVATRQAVVVPNLAADPKWVKFQDYARPFGIRSCESTPIFSNEGKVLGTFALFYLDVRDSSPRDKRIVELFTSAAAVAIERSRAEAALRELNETLEQRVQAETRERLQIWNVSQDLLAIAAVDGTLFSINPAWTATLGWPVEDLLGKSSEWLLHPADREKTRAALGQLAKGHKHFENRLRGKSGSYHWMSWTVTVDSGRTYGVARDITEQKRAEEALAASERSLRLIIDTIPALAWSARPDGSAEFFNQQYLNYIGSPAEQLLDWGWTAAVHPDDLNGLAVTWKTLLASGMPGEAEVRLRRHDGEYRWFLFRTMPLRDDDGNIVKWYGFNTDIEDRTQALARLQQMQSDFARMNRVGIMGELAASLSHEITQPIASARNNARAALNFMDKQPPDLSEVREALGGVVGDTDRAGDIVGRIRDQVRKAPPRKDYVDLNTAISEVIALARSSIVSSGVQVRTRFADGLPPVHADRVQIQQVMLNLILNAAEAMGSMKEGARELSISTEQDRTGALVAVRDSGPGIQPAQLERVFDAFYTTKSLGTGMGLSICRSIVVAHGGRLWAEENEPHGAVFKFTVPGHEAGS